MFGGWWQLVGNELSIDHRSTQNAYKKDAFQNRIIFSAIYQDVNRWEVAVAAPTNNIYTKHKKSYTILLIVYLFQTSMAFENNELSMNGQVIWNRFKHEQWNCLGRCGGIHKNVKNIDFC